MKYLFVFMLSALVWSTFVTPSTAQDRDRGRTVVIGDRNEDSDEMRKRGRTSRSDRVRTRDTRRRTENSSRRGDVVRRPESRDQRNAPWEIGRRSDDDVRTGRRGVTGKAARGGGPPFCRNGSGHPVHGRQWCLEKGWGLGNDRGLWDLGREDRRIPRRRNDRSILDDVLGRRR